MKYLTRISLVVLAFLVIPYLLTAQLNDEVTVGETGDYPTLTAFTEALNEEGLQGNTTVSIISDIIEPGQVTISQWEEFNGTGYYLTIKPANGSWTIEASVDSGAVIKLNYVSRVIIDGEYNTGERNLTITNTANGGTNTVVWIASNSPVQECSDITIKNTVIIGANTPQSNTETAGILQSCIPYNAPFNINVNGFSEYIIIQNNHIKRANYGVLINGIPSPGMTAEGIQIIGNEIGSENEDEYIRYKGIKVFGTPFVKINDNHIYNIKRSEGAVNICGLELSMYSYGGQVMRNRIHGLENASPLGFGAYGIDLPIPSGVDTIRIFNNAIYDIRTTNFSSTSYHQNPFGIRILGTYKLKLWHNSVHLYGSQVDVGTTGTLSAAIAFIAPIYYELDMRNNVFSNTLEGTEGSRSYAIWAWAFPETIDTLFTSINYNDYYAGGTYGILGNIGAPEDATNNACDPINNKYTLEEWQAATLQDSNSLAVNPEFIANDNLEPMITSPLVSAGIYFEEVPEDIRGFVRNDPPTIGAYESTGGITLLTPENLAEDITITPLFSWELVQGYNLYNIQVATDEEFENIVLEQYEIEGNSFQTPYQTPLVSFDPFFWRIQAVSESGSMSEWSEVWSFTTLLWEIVENTGSSATIVVPATIPAMIGNRQMSNGDIIGVFYQTEPDNWQCSGLGVWNGQNVSITVWGDNPDTPIKDGFADGEVFTYFVWDAVESNTVLAVATYQLGPDEFEDSGFSMLASLYAMLGDEQNFNLAAGWNCISSYIIPDDDDVEVMLASIVDNVRIMKNATGDMYVPAYNVNTIGNWDMFTAYLINMINTDVLTISGTKIVPEATPINLNFGWNLSAYFRDNEMSVITAVESIVSSLVLAKNNAGGIYSPIFGINTLGNMIPTQGYYFYLNAAAELTYPANSARKSLTTETTPIAKNLVPSFNNTGNNSTLLLSIENNDGNEIGVYNQNNVLVGSGAVHNSIAAITIWGDNETSSIIDGAIANETLIVKLLNISNNSTDNLSLINIQDITTEQEHKGLFYKSDAIYFAKAALGDNSNNCLSISNSPNPVENMTSFEFNLIEEGNAKINIYNTTGELVASFEDNYTAGMHNFYFDARNLTNGVYNVILCSGNQQVMTLMVVGK